jgi:hypothetical protein
MSSVTRPRGPLPPRVYWTRRLLVVAVALGLVFGISHLLDGSSAPADTPSARPAAAAAASSSAGLTPQAMPTAQATRDAAGAERDKNGKPEKEKTPLAVPTGPCADSDIVVEPSVDGTAYAGQDVTVSLNLSTIESPACTWEVSAESVVLKLTSGEDRIWSTQDCPAAIEEQSVVVRKDHVTTVGVTWSGQRSDEECTRTTLWAQPGYYHAVAAALGAEPRDQQFRLQTPPRPTITPTPTATASERGEKNGEKRD